jgi:hypothetical protein
MMRLCESDREAIETAIFHRGGDGGRTVQMKENKHLLLKDNIRNSQSASLARGIICPTQNKEIKRMSERSHPEVTRTTN